MKFRPNKNYGKISSVLIETFRKCAARKRYILRRKINKFLSTSKHLTERNTMLFEAVHFWVGHENEGETMWRIVTQKIIYVYVQNHKGGVHTWVIKNYMKRWGVGVSLLIGSFIRILTLHCNYWIRAAIFNNFLTKKLHLDHNAITTNVATHFNE